MTMNVNSLVIGIGSSLRGFFEFCEEQNGVKADVLDELFTQYFVDGASAPKTKAHVNEARRTYHDLSDDSDDDDTSVASSSSTKKAPVKKAPAKPKAVPVKKAAPRKPSGKGKDVKPRNEQTPLPSDLNKNKLNELKVYLKERGLPVSGNKAQLIENLLTYEKDYEKDHDEAPAELDAVEEEEDLGIQVKKPKTKGHKLCEPATKKKYKSEMRHGYKMIQHTDWYFVLNNNDVVVGWVDNDDEADVDIDDSVNIRALKTHICEKAKELGLEYEVPDNLDE
jgi:hypothetical protein